MPGNNNGPRAAEILLFTKIIAGVNHNVTAAILLGGQSTTATQLVTVFTDAIQASTALDAAKLAYQQALKAQQAAFVTAHTTEANLKSYLYGAYGAENPIVEQFGFLPRKTAVKSAQVKADAQVKAKATRVARHTMGPKQKASIHGTAPAAPEVGASATGSAAAATGGTTLVTVTPAGTK